MQIPGFRICLFLCLLGIASPAASQDARTAAAESRDEMAADRPGFSEPPDVISRGTIQIESGLTYSAEGGSGKRAVLGGSPLLRVGIGRRMEVRFGGDGFRRESSGVGAGRRPAHGFSDFGAGAKFKLVDEAGARPAVGFSSTLSLPVGRSGFTSGGYDPSFRLSTAKGLPGRLSLGANAGLALITNDNARFAQHLMALSLSRRLSDKVTASWEVYRVRQPDATAPEWQVGVAIARTIGGNAQVDVQAGRALAGGKPCWFAGYGFAVRNPFVPLFRHSAATVSRLARR
jgi:hypothetical protein